MSAPNAPQEEAFWKAALSIVFAMFFDMADGRVARLTKTESRLGMELDSLADAISFGVAPALLVFRWSLSQLGNLGIFLSFLYIACGVIRLARFNIIAQQDGGASRYSLGIPIPLGASCIVSLVIAQHGAPDRLAQSPLQEVWVIASLVVLISYLMVSTILFRTFKDLTHNKNTAIIFVGLFATAFTSSWVVLGPRAGWMLLAGLSYTYILLGLLEAVIFFKSRRQEARERKQVEEKRVKQDRSM